MRALLSIIIWMGLGLSTEIAAQTEAERITDYHVDLTVNTDRSIDVIEKIRVYANGRRIRRGITRNFPLHRDIKGQRTKVHYKINSITRDGKQEPYLTKKVSSDLVLYLGQSDYFLPSGYFEYEIKYRVPGQVVMFDDYDEIYWNVIGTGVQFPIENSSATIHLPQGTSILQQAAYSGVYGSTGNELTAVESTDRSVIKYRADRALRPNEGMTVAVGFDKGIVSPPSWFHRFGSLLVLILTGVGMLGYFIYTWFRYGIDPPTPPATVGFHPPDDLSAGSMSYILSEGYKSRSLTAAIISLAVKGYLKISSMEKGSILGKSKLYTLTKLKKADRSLPDEEYYIQANVFGKKNQVTFDGDYNSKVAGATASHRNALVAEHDEFVKEGNNLQYIALPILLSIGAVGLSYFLSTRFGVGEYATIKSLAIFGACALIAIIIYRWLIIQPTREKLKLQSEIKGFQMYLEMAEKDRMNLLNPPDMTPEHFEEMLPYAYALGVEHKWSSTFKSVLDKAGYRPQWNSGRSYYYLGNFHRDVNSDIRTTSTKPSSDGGGGGFSGSFGGGFSGGGGGGGGVGGW